jgi:hypothetical protein
MPVQLGDTFVNSTTTPTATATSTSTATTPPASTTKTPSSTVPTNAYPVGTKVTADETITQSIWDPLKKVWLNLTSKGGIYAYGGNVSGSGYSPTWTGQGRLVLANGGAKVTEYNAQNKVVGTYAVT